MSGSRRNFIKFGVLALFAAMPLKSVFGQGWKDRDGNPGNTPTQTDPLANYTEATFRSYLNSIFQLHTVAGIVEVTLVKVDSMPAPQNGECFALLFRGGARANLQDTYTIVHPSLGTFHLFLVPVGSDQNGAQGYVATINRLSFADAAKMVAPTRQHQTTQGSNSQGTGNPATSVTPPAVTPATAPITKPAAQPVTPAPRKPGAGRKPSWKDMDENPVLDNDWLSL
jgi:hypothetical protein